MSSGDKMEQARQAYMLPHNQQEIERMQNQHEWIKGSFGGLIKAPIDLFRKGQKILDSATADGTWLCDISTLFPSETELVGFDIAPHLYRPATLLPPNITLLPADLTATLPPIWTQHFDLVHQRFVFPGFPPSSIPSALHNLMACVKPGGWIQLVEPAAAEHVSDPAAAGFAALHRLSGQCMRCPNPKEVILSTLRDGGFVNIEVEEKDLVIGVFQGNRELDARGRKSMRAAMGNMSQIAGSPQALGMPDADWDTVLERFDADMEKYRTAVRHSIIWAQRPE